MIIEIKKSISCPTINSTSLKSTKKDKEKCIYIIKKHTEYHIICKFYLLDSPNRIFDQQE